MKILLVTEVYPPRAGGAGWSTRALALGLRGAGHDVTVLTTSPGSATLDGLDVRRLAVRGRKRLAVPRAFAAFSGQLGADVQHAQHPLSALGCLGGEAPERVVVTVRDHWPVCFWSTRISQGGLCPACSTKAMTRCVIGRVPAPGVLAWGAIPYMQSELRLRRNGLARAGAVLAVSEAIAAELRGVGLPRVEVLPNVVDPVEAEAVAERPPSFTLPDRFLLFIGKLEANKGATLLVPAVAAARTGLPLVVLGEGTLAHDVKFAAAQAGVPLLLRGWVEREDVLRALARATVLVFPSLWPEPLSRVLLEALALGTPVAAMETGGTREILGSDEAGLLATDAEGLTDAVARLAGESALRDRVAQAARARAGAFSPAALIPRYEAVYRRLR